MPAVAEPRREPRLERPGDGVLHQLRAVAAGRRRGRRGRASMAAGREAQRRRRASRRSAARRPRWRPPWRRRSRRPGSAPRGRAGPEMRRRDAHQVTAGGAARLPDGVGALHRPGARRGTPDGASPQGGRAAPRQSYHGASEPRYDLRGAPARAVPDGRAGVGGGGVGGVRDGLAEDLRVDQPGEQVREVAVAADDGDRRGAGHAEQVGEVAERLRADGVDEELAPATRRPCRTARPSARRRRPGRRRRSPRGRRSTTTSSPFSAAATSLGVEAPARTGPPSVAGVTATGAAAAAGAVAAGSEASAASSPPPPMPMQPEARRTTAPAIAALRYRWRLTSAPRWCPAVPFRPVT